MIYFCAQKNRRELVLQAAGLNGIDYLEVMSPSPDGPVVGSPGSGTILAVTFLKDATGLVLNPSNISITGGASGDCPIGDTGQCR